MTQWTRPRLVVAVPEAAFGDRALALSRLLELPLEAVSRSRKGRPGAPAGPDSWRLEYTQGGLALARPDGTRIRADFEAGRARAHAAERNLAGQPLARSLGLGRTDLPARPWLVDATAGLGVDGWLAASLGARVTMLEREAVTHALLSDALERARASADRVTAATAALVDLVRADAVSWLIAATNSAAGIRTRAGSPANCRPDIVYLDPMYPDRRRRARAKKGIEALHALVGPDRGNEGLLDAALELALDRVVVKRPAGAPALETARSVRARQDAIETPNTRYDRYLLR